VDPGIVAIHVEFNTQAGGSQNPSPQDSRDAGENIMG
jgi:hypothetical protein